MGLDMYLNAKKYLSTYEPKEKAIADAVADVVSAPGRVKWITLEAAYWRKANQVHAWFVDNVQKGEDDCGTYWVGREHLQKLLDICRTIKENPNKARDVLPPREGFFFGSYAVDEGYMQDIEDTISQLEPLLTDTYKDYEFEYHSSW